MHRRGILAAALAQVLLVAACASPTARGPQRPDVSTPEMPGGTATMAGPNGETGPSDLHRPADVPEELRFTAPSLNGGTIRGTDLAGSDLVIWFWAPW